jgi:Insertion element 4 transposase N-terminal
MQPGQCTLPTDETGRVLDRLAGLEQVIPPDAIRHTLQETKRVNRRNCTLTHEVMLWVVLAMGVLTDLPIRQVFKHARRLRVGEESPERSSLCMARQRLGVAPLHHLFHQVVRPLAHEHTPGAFYRGLRLMGIDGTVLDVPDSEANAAVFGRASAGPRGDGAFPQVRKLSLVELGTHVEVAMVVRPYPRGEQSMVAGLFRHLTSEMLLLWDRGFFSYKLWQQMTTRGVKLLARVTAELVLRPIRNWSTTSRRPTKTRGGRPSRRSCGARRPPGCSRSCTRCRWATS